MNCDADFLPAAFALSFHLVATVSILASVAARQWLLCGVVLTIAAAAFVVTQLVPHSAPVAQTPPTAAQLSGMSSASVSHDQRRQEQAQHVAATVLAAASTTRGDPQQDAQRNFERDMQESFRTMNGRRTDIDAQLQFELERVALLSTQFQREQDTSYWNS